jgi:hypothetical protein
MAKPQPKNRKARLALQAKKRKAQPRKAQPKYSPNFAPTGRGGPDDVYGGVMNVGGGRDDAEMRLQAQQQASAMELSRQQMGMGLMQNIQDTMRDPFSIVSALQMYGKAGGGTQGPAAALAASGGRGAPSPYGEIADRLMRGLSEFSGATPINPTTGQPMNPQEMAYLRQLSGQDIMARGGTQQQASIDLARSEPNRQSINQDAYNLPENIQGSQWPTNTPAREALRKRKKGSLKTAGNYMKSSPIARTQ